MDFGLQSPFAHHLDPGDFQEGMSSAVVTHHDEKIPMPQFYHNQQIECVNELEWETRSVRNLNNTAPIQYMKMRSNPQSEQNSSQIDIFHPAPLDPEYASAQSLYPKKVLLKNASSQFGRADDEKVQRGSSTHQTSKFDNKKGKYYSEPQSEQNSASKHMEHKEEEEDQEAQQRQLEKKHAELLKRLAAINDFATGSQDNEKEEETAVQTKEAQNSSNIESTSISFADIVKAIERVKFVPPTVQSIQEEEEGGGSFQTGHDIQRRPEDWSPASISGNQIVFSKPKRAKQKSEMTALDKLNFDGEEIKFD